MADDRIQIDVNTTANTQGLEQTRKGLDGVAASGKKAAEAATASANRHKAFGDALRNLVTGNISGAITSLQQLGVKCKDVGGVMMAGGAATAIWGSNLKKWIGAANETKKLEIEASIRNTSEAAAMLANNLQRAAAAVDSLNAREQAAAALAETMRGLTEEIDRQNIANERARELALATDDLQREAINIKYDRQLAAVDERAGRGGVESEQARIAREAAELARQNDLLRQGVAANTQVASRKRASATELGEHGDEQTSFWKTFEWNRGTRVKNATGYYDKQAAELEGVASINQDSRAKIDQIKANEAKIADLQRQIAEVLPLKRQLVESQAAGAQVGIASKAVGLSRGLGERAAEQGRIAAEEEARAAALSEAQGRHAQLTSRRADLLGGVAPAESQAAAAAQAAAEAQNRLATAGARWAGSSNTRMRDQSLAPLAQQAEAAAGASVQAQQTLQRTLQTTEEAVKQIDGALAKLNGQIARLGSRMAAGRGDVQG